LFLFHKYPILFDIINNLRINRLINSLHILKEIINSLILDQHKFT